MKTLSFGERPRRGPADALSVVWRPRWLRMEMGIELSNHGTGRVSFCGWIERRGRRHETMVTWRAKDRTRPFKQLNML
jgi:hypothetical protein